MNKLAGEFDAGLIPTLGAVFFVGLGISHAFRWIIIKWDWLKLDIRSIVPRLPIAALIWGVLFFLIHGAVLDLFFPYVDPILSAPFLKSLQLILNWSLVILLWGLLYFSYHFFERSRQQEMENLQWEASRNEVELNNLKSQLNPHFMFNSLNSIRGLIDEDPAKAKEAITQLSRILRNALHSGKKKLIPFGEELDMVRTYIELERIRLEERLQVNFDIDEETLGHQVPPLMLQTIVENAIKHGIAGLPKGGELTIKGKGDAGLLRIEVLNSGTLPRNGASVKNGIGLANTRKRIELLYGEQGRFDMEEENGQVRTVIDIPKEPAGP